MIDRYSVRTDLALEEKESFDADHVEIQGVEVEEDYNEEKEIKVTTVRIKTEKGAKMMGKPVGVYITIEAPAMSSPDRDYHREISCEIARSVKRLLPGSRKFYEIMVAGLGNRNIISDALGPETADHVQATRHLIKEYGRFAVEDRGCQSVSIMVPGVMGETGMETAEMIKGVVSSVSPDLVIAVDALAARNSKRLNRTIQITDTGISPGTGVGNHRYGINRQTVGVPVIAIGIPTVVDAATIVNDTMENLISEMEKSELLSGVGAVLQGYSRSEKYEFIKELIQPHLNGMFVTPKDIDESIASMSFIISEGLNMLFSDKNNIQ